MKMERKSEKFAVWLQNWEGERIYAGASLLMKNCVNKGGMHGERKKWWHVKGNRKTLN